MYRRFFFLFFEFMSKIQNVQRMAENRKKLLHKPYTYHCSMHGQQNVWAHGSNTSGRRSKHIEHSWSSSDPDASSVGLASEKHTLSISIEAVRLSYWINGNRKSKIYSEKTSFQPVASHSKPWLVDVIERSWKHAEIAWDLGTCSFQFVWNPDPLWHRLSVL